MSIRLCCTARALVLGSVALPLIATAAGAQCTNTEVQKLAASDAATFAAYGRDVAVREGDVALITSDAAQDRGAVYAYRWNGVSWGGQVKLAPAGLQPGDLFGQSIGLSGDAALVGSSWDDDLGTNSGSVYYYRDNGAQWALRQKLVASDGEAGDAFGFDVAVAGDVAVVGAPYDDDQGTDAGAVYVFRRSGPSWVQEQKLGVNTPGAGDNLGWSVDVDGDVIVAAAIVDDDLGSESGSVYVFRWNGASWVEEQRLLASDGGAGDWLGWGLAVEGNLIAAGANHHDAPGPNTGAVYLFRRSGASWVEEQKITPGSVQDYDAFGWAVDIDGDRVAVGSPGWALGSGPGAAYLFHHDGTRWVEAHHWISTDGQSPGFLLANLGLSVSLDGGVCLSGAPWATGGGANNAGAAYFYDVSDLALDALPDVGTVGQTLELRTYGGLAGYPMIVLLTEIGGFPYIAVVHQGVFDANGQVSLLPTVPPSAAGISLTFTSVGFFNPAEWSYSNYLTVSFL